MKFRDKAHRYDFHRDTLCAFPGASLSVTAGVKEAFPEWQRDVLGAVVKFKQFVAGDDPYGEHDFAAFEVEDPHVAGSRRLYFKWDDYTDVPPEMALPSGVGPLLLTVMLAEEY